MGGFHFKELIVWQKAMAYSIAVSDFTDEARKNGKYFRMLNQLDDSSFSVHSNIAEGNGRFSKKENIRFLHIARGSLYESVSQLIYFQLKNYLTIEQLEILEKQAEEISKMINGLINSYSKNI